MALNICWDTMVSVAECLLGYYSGFFVPFTYLPDKTLGLGYSHEDAALLLSLLGLTNTLARIAAG